MSNYSISVFDPDESRLNTLAYEFEMKGIKVTTARRIEQIDKSEMYILDISFGLENVERLSKTGSLIAVTADEIKLEDWQKLLKSEIPVFKHPVSVNSIIEGFKDYFNKPIEDIAENTQRDPLAHLLEDKETLPSKNIVDMNGNGNPKEEISVTKTRQRKLQSFKQVIVSVYSPKGGVGKTTLSMNFAAMCAEHPMVESVCLIDADRQYGNVMHTLGIKSKANLADFCRNINSLSSWEEIKQNLYRQSDKFYILPNPPSPIESLDVRGSEFASNLSVLKEYFDVIIVDMAPQLDEVSNAALKHSDIIFLVTTTDSPTNQSVKSFIKDYEKILKLDSSKLHLVVNRVLKKAGITVKDIRGAFPNVEFVGAIKEDGMIQNSANKRIFHTLKFGNSEMTQIIETMMGFINLYSDDNRRGVQLSKGGLLRMFRKRTREEIAYD
ncbi:AAA family ATPase [Aneurinibacillus thermoaerophilus]|uniref:AAA family ATPase n=1 Tax=Aneurinibacillus thermoaerophilus TaxID=143495 RepID=UPI002E23183E|nr:AAA family ATPase [Aneurinibacillus thermoaerophilus]